VRVLRYGFTSAAAGMALAVRGSTLAFSVSMYLHIFSCVQCMHVQCTICINKCIYMYIYAHVYVG